VIKTQDTGHKTQDTGCKTQDTGCKTQDARQEERNSDLESSVLGLESSSESSVLSPESFCRVLFIGDVIGRPGRVAVGITLPELKKQYKPQLVIANGENLAGGLGITRETAEELFSYGVDILTTGNHVWDKKEFLEYIDLDDRILRPANYPEGVPGKGYVVLDAKRESGNPAQYPVAIFNLSGRIFMDPLDDPFVAAKDIVQKLREEANVIILDFHAEATSEKIAMGWYLDGEVSAVIGTHTHVQTADETILPNHTAYITDVGMTGPINSVIGVKKDLIIQRFLTQMPTRFDVAKGDVIVAGVIVDIDPVTGRAISIERLRKIVKR
jgi:metallophosphoesterase (TIGR00282 family)